MKQETQKVNAKTTNLGVKTVSMMLVIITLFSFIGTALPTLASEMDSNITVKAEKVTYNGHTYQILYSTYAWNEMETYCESQGGYLACITTAEENEFLYNYVKENNCQSSTVFGFTDNGHEGNWTWVSGEETDYTNWASSEPNGGSSENWANYYSKYTKGQWNDCGYPGSCNYLVEWPYIEDVTASVYNSHTYAIYDVLDSYLQYDNAFDAAENYCEALGGHLATIESQEENDYLYKLMIDSGFNNAYFGFTDRETKGVWKWVTGEAVEYTNWNSVEPNNSCGTEDYAMFYYKYTDGTWNDGDFNGFTENGGKAFICEWENGFTSQWTISLSISGGEYITYNEAEDIYSEESFELVLLMGYLIQIGKENPGADNVKVSVTLPSGYSFSEEGEELTREYTFDKILLTECVSDTVYLKSPPVGSYEVSVKITSDNVEDAVYTHNLRVLSEDFRVNLYRANFLLSSPQLDTMEGYFNDETPSKALYEAGKESGLEWQANLWQGICDSVDLIEDPSKILDYAFEDKDVYEAIIMNIFESSVDSKVLACVNTKISKDISKTMSTVTGTMKNLYQIDASLVDDFSNYTSAELDKVCETIAEQYKEDSATFSDLGKTSKAIKNFMKYTKNLEELCEKVAMYCNIYQLGDSMKEIMEEMYEQCPSSNAPLKGALFECITIMDSSLRDFAAEMVTYTAATAGVDAAQYVFKKMWDGVVDSFCLAHPAAYALKVGYAAGVCISNVLFSTDAVTEAYFKAAAIVDTWSLLDDVYNAKKNTFISYPTENTAEIYNSAIDVMFNMLDTDCDYAISFFETVDDALANKVAALFGGQTADAVIESIETIQSSYYLVHESILTAWINQLEVDYPMLYDDYAYLLDESMARITKKYTVACPVDVYVYDADGVIVASVVDNTPYCRPDANITIGVDGDKKTIYMYGDEYTLVYEGNDEGTMDITVTEYDENGGETRSVYFTDIALTNETTYTSTDNGATSEDDAYVLLSEENEEIAPSYDSQTDADGETYTASIERGYFIKETSVSRELHAGEIVEIAAYIPDGYKFVGWTSDAGYDIFADAESVTTTITMPDCDVNITAEVEETATLKIASAENGVIEVQAFNCEEITSGTIYISVYDADGIHKATVTAPWAESVSISELEFESGDIIKAFLWDENMQPQVAFAQRLAS